MLTDLVLSCKIQYYFQDIPHWRFNSNCLYLIHFCRLYV